MNESVRQGVWFRRGSPPHRTTLSEDGSADLAQAIIQDVVERRCGRRPRQLQTETFEWQAYVLALALVRSELARGIAEYSDIRAVARIAAEQACRGSLRGAAEDQARLRSQIRCILNQTPGLALWRSLSGQTRQQWLGGYAEWRDKGCRVGDIRHLFSRRHCRVPTLPYATIPFDTVRSATLRLIDASKAPIPVETLVAAIEREYSTAASQ